MTQYDNVSNPFHYQQYGVEVVSITSLLPNNLGNIVKYLMRSPYKGSELQDLQKALQYWKFFMEENTKGHFVYAYTSEGVETLWSLVDKAFANKDSIKQDFLHSLVNYVIDTAIKFQGKGDNYGIDHFKSFENLVNNYIKYHVQYPSSSVNKEDDSIIKSVNNTQQHLAHCLHNDKEHECCCGGQCRCENK